MDEIRDCLKEIIKRLANLERSVECTNKQLGWRLDAVLSLQRIQDDLRELRADVAKAIFAPGQETGQSEEKVRIDLTWRINYIQRMQLDRIWLSSSFDPDECGYYLSGGLESVKHTMSDMPRASLGEIDNLLHNVEEKLDDAQNNWRKALEKERVEAVHRPIHSAGIADGLERADARAEESQLVLNIDNLIDEVLAANPQKVEQYRAGETTMIGFFLGQVMKTSKGKASPAVLHELLSKKLS